MTETPDSQSHLAYLALEQLIVTLKLKPGALINEKQLIDLAGHGRTPVREAIQKLAWQGLLIVRPRVGLQIAEINVEDHGRIMQLRQELEPIAAALVARHAEPAHRSQLVICAQQMAACAVNADVAGFLAADKMFDEIMEAACPNTFLTSALTPLQTHSRRLWFAGASPERMDHSIALHVAVIRAVQQGDIEGARKAMQALMEYLSKN